MSTIPNPAEARTRDYAAPSPMIENMHRVASERQADAAAAYVELLRRADAPQPGDAEELRGVLRDLEYTEADVRDHLAVLRHADELAKQAGAIPELERAQRDTHSHHQEVRKQNRREIERLEKEMLDAQVASRAASNRLSDAKHAAFKLDRLRMNYSWLIPSESTE